MKRTALVALVGRRGAKLLVAALLVAVAKAVATRAPDRANAAELDPTNLQRLQPEYRSRLVPLELRREG